MTEPYKCPICEGKGSVKKKKAQVGAQPYMHNPDWYLCHGCNGAGIIWSINWWKFSDTTFNTTGTIIYGDKAEIQYAPNPVKGSICTRCNKGAIVYSTGGCQSCWHCDNKPCNNRGCANHAC